jgi:hypothetical protein
MDHMMEKLKIKETATGRATAGMREISKGATSFARNNDLIESGGA